MIARILAADDVLGTQRLHRLENLDPLVTQSVGLIGDWRFHGEQGDELDQMVLDHIAQCSNRVIEGSPTLDSEVLRHRDLDASDVVAVPDGLEDRVGEPVHHQVLHRILAEEVVDAKDARFRVVTVDDLVQLGRACRVTPEWLLDNETPVTCQPGAGQTNNNVIEEVWRDCEIGDGHRYVAQTVFDGVVGSRIAIVA